jgi:hypothetical protein
VLSTFEARKDIVPSGGYAVAVMINSFTTTREQAFEISHGIIQIMEGNTPDIGRPTPMITDLFVGLFTLVYLTLGIKGITRSKQWTNKRSIYPAWKFCLRLLPQVIPVAAIGWLFFIVPGLENNSSTIKDAFGLWFAAMLFLAVVFVVGLVLTIMRTFYRRYRS